MSTQQRSERRYGAPGWYCHSSAKLYMSNSHRFWLPDTEREQHQVHDDFLPGFALNCPTATDQGKAFQYYFPESTKLCNRNGWVFIHWFFLLEQALSTIAVEYKLCDTKVVQIEDSQFSKYKYSTHLLTKILEHPRPLKAFRNGRKRKAISIASAVRFVHSMAMDVPQARHPFLGIPFFHKHSN